jgi:hypothetical protein
MVNEERLQILDMIAQGKITAQEGVQLLSALEESDDRADQADRAGDLPAGVTPAGEVSPGEAHLPLEPVIPQAEAIPPATFPPVMEAAAGTGNETRIPDIASATPRPTDMPPEPVVVEDLPESPSFDPRAEKWRGWWRIPLWIGVITTVLTGLLLYSIYNAAGFNFWFACAWFPFLISVAILALAWASRSAHWLHVRVHQRPGERPQNIAISFPIPLSLMGWFLRTFRSKIPKMQGVNPDEMILALNHVSPEKPFYVEVNEEDGERVEVYIG